MRKVVEEDLGEPLEDVFSDFGEEAVAAASIGQVYRARVRDGREVAVKVQYPGVDRAIRADLQNLGMIMRVAKRIAPGMDAKAMTAEIKQRLGDELDYELEAQSQRAFARAWRGHPFIVVPDVDTRLSREHVLVTEWVDGAGFDDVLAMGAATRDRFGEIVFRFFFGSLHRNRHFSGDPHPGNYKLLPDGRVAFLDFGMVKQLEREQVAAEADAIRLGMEGDAGGLHARMAAMGFFDAGDELVAPDELLEHFRAVTAWYVDDRRRDDRARARRAGPDRPRRPALGPLGADEADDAAAAGAAGAPDGGAHPRRAREARGDGELAQDRARAGSSERRRRPRSGSSRRSSSAPARAPGAMPHPLASDAGGGRGIARRRGDGGPDRPLRRPRRGARAARPAPRRRLRRAAAGNRRPAALD